MRMTIGEYKAIYDALWFCTPRGEDFNHLPLGKKQILIKADDALKTIRERSENEAKKI